MGIYRKYFKRYRAPFLVAVICVACEAVCDLLGPTLMARIIDNGIESKAMQSVLYWGGLMLLVTFVGACFAVTRNILASRVSQRMGADLRFDLFEKMMSFSETGADRIQSGSLITRMTNDTAQITQFVNGIMRIFMKAPITCVGSIVLASMLNLKLSFIVYGVVAGVGILIFISMKLSYPRFSRLQKAMDRVNSVVQEYLIGVRLVKAFGAYPEEEEKFSAANENLKKKGVSSQIVITLLSPIMTLLVGLGTVLVIFLGSELFSLQLARPGDISAFTIYLAQILSSLLMITNIFNTLVRTKASTVRIREVLDCGEDARGGEINAKPAGAVRFEDVTFTYPNGSGIPALKKLSFEVKPGENLAIIGPTGSGKSTICWLLLRFYEADSGKIWLDGKEIGGYSADRLREGIAVAPQNPMLFSGTVRENILWGKPDASADDVAAAVNDAEAGFTANMPQGMDSFLGSGGVNLSGGQKQRISLARALMRDSSVLILDDATSALDAVTEAKVRKHLDRRGGTKIIVTQRCTTAMFSDKILVMENGEAVGFGTHEELLHSCAIYGEIYRSQVDTGRGEAV